MTLTHKLRYKAVQHGVGPLVTLLARRDQAALVATVLAASMGREQRARPGAAPGLSVLLLPKAGFTEDMRAVFADAPGYTLWTLDRMLVKAVFAAFLPVTIDDMNYVSDDPAVEDGKRRLRAFWRRVLRHLRRSVPLDVMMTGNFSYAAEQELAAALEAEGTRVVVVHKECLKSPGLAAFYTRVYRERKGPFQGTVICSYNVVERDIQVAAGIVPQARTRVVGMPRMDRLFHLPPGRRSERPTILVFSLNAKTGLPMIGRKTAERFERLDPDLERLNCRTLAREVHQAACRVARANPDVSVLIKTKGDVQSLHNVRDYLDGGDGLPPNLKIVHGGDLIELIRAADVVCSFNSTTLFEALALDLPIVLPWFAEAVAPDYGPYVVDLGDCVQKATSPEDLDRRLVETARAHHGGAWPGYDAAVKAAMLDHWLGNPDGGAGARVRAVLEEVAASRGAA